MNVIFNARDAMPAGGKITVRAANRVANNANIVHDGEYVVLTIIDCGSRALELLRQDPTSYDLLLTDYAMPRGSGTELIRKAREICRASGPS